MARLKTKYTESVKPALQSEFEIKNQHQIPALEKIVISVGTGFAMKDNKLIANIQETISNIAGQKAVVIKAKKSVAGFKVREDMPTGIKVTLRGENMYTFLDRLVAVALPRVKDFRGVNRKGFDGRGNFNFGLDEQLIFTEVDYDSIMQVHGMNITMVTTTDSDTQAFRLLELMGVPFTKGHTNG
jgi:large subunit ribosomal protein L5